MVVVIDNYDSFTYNLVQALGVLGAEIRVFRNDRTTLEELRRLEPERISHAFGGKVVRAGRLMHGKTSEIEHDGRGVLTGLPNPFTAARYHSLIVPGDGVPEGFDVTSRTRDRGEVMGIRHTALAVEGVQFHPESFLTPDGMKLMRNFVEGTAEGAA